MNTSNIIFFSGMLQIFVAIILGWLMVFQRTSTTVAAIFKQRQRLLQSHIDDILMGGLQMLIALSFAALSLANSHFKQLSVVGINRDSALATGTH